MKPDQLMALTAGRTMDLVGIAQREIPTSAWRELLKFDGPRPHQTPVHRDPEWTPEDAALACGGLAPKFYAAFALRYAGDDGVRSTLWAALIQWAEYRARAEGWQLHVEEIPLLRGVADLVILMEYLTIRQPEAVVEITSRDLWHAYFGASVHLLARVGQPDRPGPKPRIGVTVEAWERHVAMPFKETQATVDRWCSIAYSHASRRMREEDDEGD